MTLIVAAKSVDGIVLAADSRGTYGDPRGVTAQNDSMVKLYPLARHVGVLLTGDAGLGNQILASWQSDRNAAVTASQIMEQFRLHAKAQFAAWFTGFSVQPIQGSTMPTRPVLNFVLAGYEYDAAGTAIGPVLYSLPSMYDFAPVRLDHGFALDGVAQYALYLFNRLYRTGYSNERLKSLAAYAITETASQDGKVGGPVRMAVITPGEGYQDVGEPGVADIIKQNAERSEALRLSFFGETDGS